VGERISVYRAFVGKPEEKSRVGGSGCRGEDNINMNLQDVGYGGMDWFKVA
jgi:hypothetical protein